YIFDLVIGIVALGLSVGTKLHVTFYFPLLLAIAAYLLIHRHTVMAELSGRLLRKHSVEVLGALCIAVLFSCGFLGYNYISAGQLADWEFNAQLLNQPFSWRAALQTNILYIAQTVLTPVADLRVALSSGDPAQHYAAFNQVLAPLFLWVNNSPEYVSDFYRFSGVNTPSSVVFNEQTIFIGFTWLVWLVAACRLFSARVNPNVLWARFQIASLPVWFVTFAALTRYVEGISVYLGYATVVCAPALVYAFAPVNRLWLSGLRWALLSFVAASHCFMALSILLWSNPRNLVVVTQAPRLPISRGFAIDADVLDEVARANDGIVDRYIAWGQPHWAFMAYIPRIRHYFASVPPVIQPFPGSPDKSEPYELLDSRFVLMPQMGEKRLNIYTFRQFPLFGDVAIRIRDKPSPGLTWIGNIQFVLGPEWVFAAGNGVETRHPDRDKYIVVHFDEVSNFGRDPQPFLNVKGAYYGLGPSDDLDFRYELRIADALMDQTEWKASPQAKLKDYGRSEQNGILTVFVRNNATGRVYKKDVPLRAKQPLLLERND
ncbi:MAG: hypothetical protein ACRD3W_13295, partial [Terriglobales bacterium]